MARLFDFPDQFLVKMLVRVGLAFQRLVFEGPGRSRGRNLPWQSDHRLLHRRFVPADSRCIRSIPSARRPSGPPRSTIPLHGPLASAFPVFRMIDAKMAFCYFDKGVSRRLIQMFHQPAQPFAFAPPPARGPRWNLPFTESVGRFLFQPVALRIGVFGIQLQGGAPTVYSSSPPD